MTDSCMIRGFFPVSRTWRGAAAQGRGEDRTKPRAKKKKAECDLHVPFMTNRKTQWAVHAHLVHSGSLPARLPCLAG